MVIPSGESPEIEFEETPASPSKLSVPSQTDVANLATEESVLGSELSVKREEDLSQSSTSSKSTKIPSEPKLDRSPQFRASPMDEAGVATLLSMRCGGNGNKAALHSLSDDLPLKETPRTPARLTSAYYRSPRVLAFPPSAKSTLVQSPSVSDTPTGRSAGGISIEREPSRLNRINIPPPLRTARSASFLPDAFDDLHLAQSDQFSAHSTTGLLAGTPIRSHVGSISGSPRILIPPPFISPSARRMMYSRTMSDYGTSRSRPASSSSLVYIPPTPAAVASARMNVTGASRKSPERYTQNTTSSLRAEYDRYPVDLPLPSPIKESFVRTPTSAMAPGSHHPIFAESRSTLAEKTRNSGSPPSSQLTRGSQPTFPHPFSHHPSASEPIFVNINTKTHRYAEKPAQVASSAVSEVSAMLPLPKLPVKRNYHESSETTESGGRYSELNERGSDFDRSVGGYFEGHKRRRSIGPYASSDEHDGMGSERAFDLPPLLYHRSRPHAQQQLNPHERRPFSIRRGRPDPFVSIDSSAMSPGSSSRGLDALLAEFNQHDKPDNAAAQALEEVATTLALVAKKLRTQR